MVKIRSALVAAALLTCGCELIVGTEGKTIEITGSDDAAADAGADAGEDAIAPDAAAPDASAVDAGACQTCGTRLTACQTQCTQTSTSCQAQCSDNGCIGKCTKTEMQCSDACTMACASCVQIGGCGDMSVCHPMK